MSQVTELQNVIGNYLETHQRISLNGLSKRCSVSEATLRRIMSDKVKTAPTLTTIVDILSTISKESNIRKLAELYPGPLADVLKEGFNIFEQEQLDYVYSQKLNEVLADETNYLIYKWAANTNGIPLSKVKEVFGLIGEEKLSNMVNEGLIEEHTSDSTPVYHAKIKGFSLDHKLFVKNFKAMTNFIKTDLERGPKTNLYYNFSESVSEVGRKEILRIQRGAIRKIAKLLNDEKYRGEIPLFVLSAIDDMDSKEKSPTSLLQ